MMAGIFGAYADKQWIYFPGAPFLVGAALMVVSISIYAITVRRYYSATD